VLSNVYDVVCVSGLSIRLDYPFGVSNVYDVVCVSRLSTTLDRVIDKLEKQTTLLTLETPKG
jgi:hypothetical protein